MTTTDLPLILSSGVLRTTESNVSRKREHSGPDVVWLTTQDTVTEGNGLENAEHDKFGIRFTVDIDRRAVKKWREWALSKGIDANWMTTLASVRGSGSWRVTEQPIQSDQWIEIRNMRTDEVVPRET